MSMSDRFDGWLCIALAAFLPIAIYGAPFIADFTPRYGPFDFWLSVLGAVGFLYLATICFSRGWLHEMLVTFGMLALAFVAVLTALGIWCAGFIGPGFGPNI